MLCEAVYSYGLVTKLHLIHWNEIHNCIFVCNVLEFLDGESVVAGVVSQDYNVEELPGCHPKSLGYHSDDGG